MTVTAMPPTTDATDEEAPAKAGKKKIVLVRPR